MMSAVKPSPIFLLFFLIHSTIDLSNGFQPYVNTPINFFASSSSHPRNAHIPKRSAAWTSQPYTSYKIPSDSQLHSYPNENDNGDKILNRFISPKIDDAGLPIADSLVAQIVGPTLQVFWLSANHAPSPTWLAPIYSNSNGLLYNTPAQGALLVPTLIHGAGLAGCWLMGALAARAYDSEAFNVSGGRGYGTVIRRIVQAGAFATGVLILGTQLDLLLEFGRFVQPGESDEIDVRLLNAIVEVINDVFFEAIVLSSWRVYRASLTAKADGRPPNSE